MPEFKALKTLRDAYAAHTGTTPDKVGHAALIRVALNRAAKLAAERKIEDQTRQIPGFPVTRFSFQFSMPDEYALQEIADALMHEHAGRALQPPRSELIRIALIETAKLAERGELFARLPAPCGAPVFEEA